MEIKQTVVNNSLPNSERYKNLPVTFSKNPDVLALAGVWKENPITAEELRKIAWGVS